MSSLIKYYSLLFSLAIGLQMNFFFLSCANVPIFFFFSLRIENCEVNKDYILAVNLFSLILSQALPGKSGDGIFFRIGRFPKIKKPSLI